MEKRSIGHSLEWKANTSASTPSAVALVIHGLNINPVCMDPLIRELNECGVATLGCALSGHGPNYLPISNVTEGKARLAWLGRVSYKLWRDETAAAARVAAQQAERLGVPLVLAAFSLGALIGCTAALHCADIRFAKLVLFAPALRIHRRSYFLRLLARWPQLVIPSATPATYRANPGTTIAAYNALYAAQGDCERLIGPQLNVPSLVLVDPADEMVSSAGLQQLVAQRNLTRWQVQHVHKTKGATTRYHHLLIDQESVGVAAWRSMMAHMCDHLGL
jgi:hypothetical protein